MSNLDLGEEARIQREKINYFNSKVGKDDFDLALNYLIQADWDEKVAVQIYMNVFSPNNSNNNSIRNSQNNSNQSQQQASQKNNNLSVFPIKENFNNSVPYKNNDSSVYSNFISYLNSKFTLVSKSFDNFLKGLKEHAGIVILLDTQKINEAKNNFNSVINDDLCSDIVKNSILFPVMKDSSIGNEFSQKYSCSNFPSYIFCKYKSQKDIYTTGNMGGLFDKVFLIDCLLNSVPESKPDLKASLKKSIRRTLTKNINNINNNNNNNNNNQNLNDFCLGNTMELNELIEKLSKEERNDIKNRQNIDNNNSNNNNLNNSIGLQDSMIGLSDGERNLQLSVRMKQLERQQEEKEKKEAEEKRRKIEEQKRKEEEEKRKKKEEEDKIKNYEREAEFSKEILPEEPEENNSNACNIVFRYPTGEKNIERRFLKTEKIDILYFFVKSKGREIFFENDSNDFDLFYGFPPKNLENFKDKTLEEEGMSHNAIIQIREKE